MIPWEHLDIGQVPGERGQLTLHRRGGEYSIRIDGEELMNSRVHDSEEALARLGCGYVAARKEAAVLIGGLGMGYTLAAALDELKADARVTVAELVPKVIEWNRGVLAELAGAPLEDTRCRVFEGDVGGLLKGCKESFDAIVLDVDNGPQPLTRLDNAWLYSREGLTAAHRALCTGGVLAVWSSGPDEEFARRLWQTGFRVEQVNLRARGRLGGNRHIVWLAQRK